MGFEVSPTGAGRGDGLRSGFLVAAVMVATIAVAVGTGGSSGGSSVRPDPSDAAAGVMAEPGTSTGSGRIGATRPAPRPTLRPVPTSVTCHGMATVSCGEVVSAALAELPADAPGVRSAQVWGTILCDDDRDCPAARLTGYRPLGSAILGFGPAGPTAWVNVVEPSPYPGRVWDPLDVRAWVIRWIDAPVGGTDPGSG